jgi:hypothetical protein
MNIQTFFLSPFWLACPPLKTQDAAMNLALLSPGNMS